MKNLYRTPRSILVAWFVVLAVVMTILPGRAGATNHEHTNPRLHNRGIHLITVVGYGSGDEDYCHQVYDGTLASDTMKNVIQDALHWQPSHWDRAANGYLDLWHTGNNCFAYSSRTWIEFQYESHVTQTGNKWCANGISCTSHYNQVAIQSENPDHMTDYMNEIMYMEQDHVDVIDATSRQIVSHETGHAIGYRDPVSSNPCPAGETPSIMHIPYYGCSNPGTGPTSLDLNHFQNHMIYTSSN